MAGNNLYLDNLEEFVFDENRIVTYKWLSQTLQVHVNQAKQMLYKFFTQQREKDANSINATYVVSGVEESDHGEKIRKVSVVNAHDLEKHKSSLQEVSGVHVYSVQKSQLKDSNSLFTSDYDLTLEQIKQTACNRYSAIKCTEAKARSEKELVELDEKARLPDVSSHQVNEKSTSTSNHSRLTNGMTSSTNSVTTDQQNIIPAKTNGQKKGQRSAMDMFTSMKVQKQKDNEPQKSASKVTSSITSKTKQEKKPAKGMLAFMSKKPKADDKQEEAMEKRLQEIEMQKEENVISVKNVEVKKETVNTQPKKNKSNPKVEANQPKQQKKIKRNAMSDSEDEESNPKKKQRRRIMMAESSSEEEDESDDEPIPPTPPPPQQMNVVDNIQDEEDEMEYDGSTEANGSTQVRKVKVCKTRQVLDDDGFMVTEKYYEYEEVEVVENNRKTGNDVKKTVETESKNVKGKKMKGDKTSHTTTQKSLMSFFKKT